MGNNAHSRLILALALALVAGQFLLDASIPNGLADWVLYFIPLFLTTKVGGRYASYLLAALISSLMLLGFHLAPPGGIEPDLALNGRLIGIGSIWIIALLIARQKEAHAKLERTDRALRIVSLCNQVMVRAATEDELLKQICQVITERGGFRMAWIGFAENDERKSVRVAACAGDEDGYLERARVSWSEADERGRGPTGTAIRSGHPVVVNDFQHDPRTSPWWSEARKRGFFSSVSLPLSHAGVCYGVMMLYAGQREAFHEQEVDLLRELTNDIAYGLYSLRNEAERKAAEEALRLSENRLAFLISNTPVILYALQEKDGLTTTYISPNVQHVLGYAAADFVRDPAFWFTRLHPDDAEAATRAFATIAVDGVTTREYRFRHADGTYRWMHDELRIVQAGAGPGRSLVGYRLDITHQKEAEEKLHRSETLFRSFFEKNTAVQLVMEAATGDLQDANEAAARFYGWPVDQLRRMNIRQINTLPPEEIAGRIGQASQGQHSFFEFQHRLANGSIRDVAVYSTPIEADGKALLYSIIHDITGRKQAEAALQIREEIFSSIVNQAADAVVLVDCETAAFREFNAAAHQGLGYTREEFAALRIHDIEGQQSPQEIEKNIGLLRAGKPLTFETRHRRHDGTLREARVSSRLLRIQGRDYITSIWTDITEAKHQAREAASQQRFVADLIDHSSLQIYVKDRAGRYLLVNQAFETISDRKREVVLGRTDVEVFPGHDGERFRQNDLAIMASGLARTMEEELTGADGRPRTFISTKFPVRDGTGAIIGLCGMTLEITERKQIEEAHTQLATVVEQASEVIVVTDLRGTIQYVNPAFEQSTGYSRAEALGQNPRILKSGKHDEAFYRNLWETLKRGETWRGRFINRRKDGPLYYEDASITPIRNAAGKVINYVAAKRDVTREVQLEAQFLQAQKMEAVGRLAGGVAHDFNNILQAILGFCEMLLDEMPKDGAHRQDVLEIQKSATSATGLTRQLLAFSRRQALNPTVVELNQLVKNTKPMLQRIVGEDIRLAEALAPDLYPIKADAGNIEQVIMNLVVNARDAMPGGGTLTLATRNIEFAEEELKDFSAARAGRFVCLSVTDTGCGMSKEVLEHIFEPFFSTKGPEKGTGLGLSVIYGIAQQHQGWVNAYSEEGKGSTFRVYFPALPVDRSEGSGNTDGARPASARGKGESILIIEDDAVIGSLYERMLGQAGYRIHLAKTASAAREVFAKEHGRFDLIFTDVVLPDGNGYALAESFLKTHPHLAVLVCSGYTDERIRWKDAQDLGFRFLNKPTPVQELLQTIRSVLEENRAKRKRSTPA